MAIALVSTVNMVPGANGGTSTSMDTTGATLLVVSVSSYLLGAVPAVSDAKGNVYTALTNREQGTIRARLFYCLSPVVGAGHTITVVTTGGYPAVVAYAFSEVVSYQAESGATNTSGTSLASGSLTPGVAGALILTGIGGGVATTDTVTPSGFTVTTRAFVGGGNMQGSAAWHVQAVAAPINPTWNCTPAQTPIVVVSAVFLPSGSGGSGGGRRPLSFGYWKQVWSAA